MSTRFLINQCQIIIFLILKSDNIENSGIDLKGTILQVLSNQSKLHLFLFYPSTWYICDFFLFHIEIERKCGLIIGGGEQRVCWSPVILRGVGGAGPTGPPLPTPMKVSETCYNFQLVLFYFCFLSDGIGAFII